MRADHSERLASETVEEREARLERTRTNRSEVLASETPDQRETRLERIHATETPEHRNNDKFKLHINRDVFSTALHVHVNHYQNYNTDVSEGSPLRYPTSH